MSYHSHGVYWTPRTKKELIGSIVLSGKWVGTKASLQAMDIKQVRAIFHRIRNAHFTDLMYFKKEYLIKSQSAESAKNPQKQEVIKWD